MGKNFETFRQKRRNGAVVLKTLIEPRRSGAGQDDTGWQVVARETNDHGLSQHYMPLTPIIPTLEEARERFGTLPAYTIAVTARRPSRRVLLEICEQPDW